MGANELQSRELSIGIDEENNYANVFVAPSDCYIYRVPQYLRQINKKAYTPRLISIGPLHYGKTELIGMENLKRIYWSKFCQKVNAHKLKELKTYIRDEEQRIRNHYLVTSKLESSEFVTMILYDAFFIIELFLRNYYDSHDFFPDIPQMFNDLVIDLLLLENQLPYNVLNDLYMKACPNAEVNPSFFDLCLNFFATVNICNWSFSEQPKVKHFTDLLRHAAVEELRLPRVPSNISDLPSATQLNESGMEFKPIKGKCFLDISWVKRRRCCKWLPWFEINEVRIPCIPFYDDIEVLFRNLMALEVFHYPYLTYICSYAILMDYLIDTSKDVDLLVEKGIIVNCMGDSEAIAKMLNRLCSYIVPGASCYYEIAKKMKRHYKYPWNHWKATLMSVYFSNLWTGTATVGATLLLIFTLIQTVCSIMQVRQGHT